MYHPIQKSIFDAYNRYRPDGPKAQFCYVPYNNLFFTFNGKVITCPYNQKVVVGQYPNNTIQEMWESKPIKKLRDHLQNNDLSNGCEHCKHYLENGKFSGLKPQVFDKYSDVQSDQMPKVFEFSLENTCNLECIMCSGEVSSSIRQNRDKLPPIVSPYDDKFIEQLLPFIPHLKEAKFYGGEPFMIPIYFKIWDKIFELNKDIRLFVITNGTKLNSNIKSVLERQKFEIAVSIDGVTDATYNSIRGNANFSKVKENLEYYNQYCLNNGYPLTISFTAMRNNWRELPKMVEWCQQLKAHIYISYVHKPYNLALWNLSPDEIEKIIAELKKPESINLTRGKSFNRIAYQDFITYLESCMAKNSGKERTIKKNIRGYRLYLRIMDFIRDRV